MLADDYDDKTDVSSNSGSISINNMNNTNITPQKSVTTDNTNHNTTSAPLVDSDQDSCRLYLVLADMLGNIFFLPIQDDDTSNTNNNTNSVTATNKDKANGYDCFYTNITSGVEFIHFEGHKSNSSSNSIINSISNSYNNNNNNATNSNNNMTGIGRLLCDMKLCQLVDSQTQHHAYTMYTPRHIHTPSNSPLCLVGIFETGDIVVYQCLRNNMNINIYTKVDHTVVTHRSIHTRNNNKILHEYRTQLQQHYDEYFFMYSPRSETTPRVGQTPVTSARVGDTAMISARVGTTPINSARGVGQTPLTSARVGEDENNKNHYLYIYENPPPDVNSSMSTSEAVIQLYDELKQYKLTGLSVNNNNQTEMSSIYVPGNHPAVIINCKDYCRILPLSLPELPYANTGCYQTYPLYLPNKSLSGVITLWYENNSDLQLSSFLNHQPKAMKVTVTVPATNKNILSFYYHKPLVTNIYNNSIATCLKTDVGATIHFCHDILPHTDDKTELALLTTKTHVLACSNIVKKPFTPYVLTDEEMKIEEENYDRFIPDLTSFCQPNETLAPAPLLESTQHKVVLVQGNTAIDEYFLKENEQILGKYSYN